MSRRGALFVLSLIIAVALGWAEVFAFNIYQVGDEVTGQEHNDVWKQWFDRKFSIWVGIDAKVEYVIFKAETGLSDATVRVKNTKAVRDKLERAIAKSIEWAEVARKNHADTTKPLGCFGSDQYGICAKNGTAFEENQLGLRFFASNGGKQTDLIVSIVDEGNQFIKAAIYLEPPQIEHLLNVIRGIESALKEAAKATGKQELFK